MKPPRGILLDIAGVLLAGEDPMPGAVAALRRLASSGLPYGFVTNTTSKPRRRVLAALRKAGFAAEADQLFTPAGAARTWLANRGLTPHLLTAPQLAEDFQGLAPDHPPAVVVGDAGPGFTYEALNRAFRLILEGAPFLALAMNRRFADAEGRPTLDAGAFVTALSYGSGIEPVLFGKPAPDFFTAACAGLGAAPAEVAMIGDDAEADVAGALKAGIGQAILVRTGKYRAGDEAACSPAPSVVVSDIGEAVDVLLAQS